MSLTRSQFQDCPHSEPANCKSKEEEKQIQSRTFQRTETSIKDQLQIAQLTFCEDNCRQFLSLGLQLIMARGVAGDQVLEDTAVGFVRHCSIDDDDASTAGLFVLYEN